MNHLIFGEAKVDPKQDAKYWPHSPEHLVSLAFDLAISECECSAQAFECCDDPEFATMGNGHRKTLSELKKLKPLVISSITAVEKLQQKVAILEAEQINLHVLFDEAGVAGSDYQEGEPWSVSDRLFAVLSEIKIMRSIPPKP